MFLEAADTILELRDDLQLANAAVQDAEHDESMAWDRVRKVEVENVKLRELFEKTYGYYVSGTLTPCDFCKRLDCEGNAPTTCEADEYDPDGIVNNEIERLMRELGIEVE
jgi:hypothetical protein